MASSTKNGSTMSRCRCVNSGTRMCSMLRSEPVSKLSTQITRWPRRSSSSQRWDPRKPAPPVTSDVGMAASLVARCLDVALLEVVVGHVDALAHAVREGRPRQPLPDHGTALAAGAVLAAAVFDSDGFGPGKAEVRAEALPAPAFVEKINE